MEFLIRQYIQDSINIKNTILNDDDLITNIMYCVNTIVDALNQGGKVFFAGNGGSAADAQHIAAEFVCKLYNDRQSLPAIAITTDTSILTAVSNDYGYEMVYSRQLEALAETTDIFIAISTSGNSENILRAVDYCKENDIYTIGLTGETGGGMTALCDVCLHVPSSDTARIQEIHILIGHILCYLVEQKLAYHKLS
jgi:D-sedoheptulose 7-phosphate isomerase